MSTVSRAKAWNLYQSFPCNPAAKLGGVNCSMFWDVKLLLNDLITISAAFEIWHQADITDQIFLSPGAAEEAEESWAEEAHQPGFQASPWREEWF